jgi:hypothetical protein
MGVDSVPVVQFPAKDDLFVGFEASEHDENKRVFVRTLVGFPAESRAEDGGWPASAADEAGLATRYACAESDQGSSRWTKGLGRSRWV